MATKKIPAIPPRNFAHEIATTGDAQDNLRGPVDIWQPQEFGILKDIAGNLETFERVLTDYEVQSVLGQRRLALVGKDWSVEAASESPEDVAAADYQREVLEALNWDDINDKMHYGIFYGFSVAELMYKRDGPRITVSDIKVRNRKRFRYDAKGRLRLLTRNSPAQGDIMPPGKFWTFATGGDNSDNPYGIGLAHWLYWPTYFKNNGVKFWMIFLDKFAMPTALGRHDFGDDRKKIGKLLEALEAIHTDSGVAIPSGVEISLLEAIRSGTTDYETFCKYMDSAIQKVTVGQVASSQGTPGKLGNEDLQAEVRYDIIKADSDLICESWNRGPGRWLTAWNFPGATPPKVSRAVAPPEDLKTRAETDTKVASIGFKPTLDYITATYGEGWEEKEIPDSLRPGGETPDKGDKGGPQFAAPKRRPRQRAPALVGQLALPPEDAFDTAIEALLMSDEELNRQTEQILDPIFSILENNTTEQAMIKITKAYPAIESNALQEALARAMFVSHVLGRVSA